MSTTLLDVIEEPLPRPPDIEPGPEAPTPRRPPRFPAFDGLRAIAAVTVVGVHTAFVSGFDGRQPGFGIYAARLEIGVSVFFLISGFLLYRPFVVAHLAGTIMPRVGAFWARRLLRIVPAYWLVLFVMTTLWHNPPGIGPSGWWSQTVHYMFLQIYFPDQVVKGLSAAWSLCVEMTFYLFVPFYAMVIRRGRARRTAGQAMRREFVGLVCMIAASYTWRSIVIAHQTPKGGWWALATVWLPAYLDLFALGMFLAATSAWFHQHDNEWRIFSNPLFPLASWICAGACFWGVSHLGIPTVPLYEETYRDLTRQLLYGGFAFFLLLPAVYGPQGRGKGPVRWFLGTWPMASLGVISYGIYLWHEPWIYRILHSGPYVDFSLNFGAFFACVLGLSIVSASLSYFIVEKPILRYKNTLSWWRKPAGVPSLRERSAPRAQAEPGQGGNEVADQPEAQDEVEAERHGQDDGQGGSDDRGEAVHGPPPGDVLLGVLAETGDLSQPDGHEHAEADAQGRQDDERDHDAGGQREAEERVGHRRESEEVEEAESREHQQEDGDGAPALLHPLTGESADAGEDEQGHQRDGERVGGEAEEEVEQLYEGDLEEDEPEAHPGEEDAREPFAAAACATARGSPGRATGGKRSRRSPTPRVAAAGPALPRSSLGRRSSANGRSC